MMAADPAPGRLRVDLGARLRLAGARTFALGHTKTPLKSVGTTSRRHHPDPAEAHGRGRGRGAKRSHQARCP
jgi:hypothetical protein